MITRCQGARFFIFGHSLLGVAYWLAHNNCLFVCLQWRRSFVQRDWVSNATSWRYIGIPSSVMVFFGSLPLILWTVRKKQDWFIFDLWLQGNFMEMPIADNTFDAAYALQATCHAPDAVCLSPYFCPKHSWNNCKNRTANIDLSWFCKFLSTVSVFTRAQCCLVCTFLHLYYSEVPTVRSTECWNLGSFSH